MLLLVDQNGVELRIGDTVHTFRGERMTLAGMTPPAHPGSTGRVYLTDPKDDSGREFYPSVIGAKWWEAIFDTTDEHTRNWVNGTN